LVAGDGRAADDGTVDRRLPEPVSVLGRERDQAGTAVAEVDDAIGYDRRGAEPAADVGRPGQLSAQGRRRRVIAAAQCIPPVHRPGARSGFAAERGGRRRDRAILLPELLTYLQPRPEEHDRDQTE